MTDKEFLRLLFNEVLGRLPSDYEFGYWGVVMRVSGRPAVRRRIEQRHGRNKGQREGRSVRGLAGQQKIT